MKSCIVFCVCDRSFFLREAVYSVINEGFDIKIWDNGSTNKHVLDCLESLESLGFPIIRCGENIFFDWAVKEIWDRFLQEYDFVVIAEDCAIIASGTLKEMERVAFSDPRIAVVGPTYSTGCYVEPGQPKFMGIWDRWPQMSVDFPLCVAGEPSETLKMKHALGFGDGKKIQEMLRYEDPIIWETIHEVDQTVFGAKKEPYFSVGGYIPRFRYGWPTTCEWGGLLRNIGYHIACARHTFVLNSDHHPEIYPKLSRDTEYDRTSENGKSAEALSSQYGSPDAAYQKWIANFVHFGVKKDGSSFG